LFSLVRNPLQHQALVQNAVLRHSRMFSLISASTVVFDREFGGRFQENSMAGKLKPSMSNRNEAW
jgi:hypothetical protein